jgi:hypothetical protein
VLVRKQVRMSPDRPLKADTRRAEKKAARNASKNARAEARKAESKRGEEKKNGYKRTERKEWKSRFGSFMFKSSKHLVEV